MCEVPNGQLPLLTALSVTAPRNRPPALGRTLRSVRSARPALHRRRYPAPGPPGISTHIATTPDDRDIGRERRAGIERAWGSRWQTRRSRSQLRDALTTGLRLSVVVPQSLPSPLTPLPADATVTLRLYWCRSVCGSLSRSQPPDPAGRHIWVEQSDRRVVLGCQLSMELPYFATEPRRSLRAAQNPSITLNTTSAPLSRSGISAWYSSDS